MAPLYRHGSLAQLQGGPHRRATGRNTWTGVDRRCAPNKPGHSSKINSRVPTRSDHDQAGRATATTLEWYTSPSQSSQVTRTSLPSTLWSNNVSA
jgi:hypothetical protein